MPRASALAIVWCVLSVAARATASAQQTVAVDATPNEVRDGGSVLARPVTVRLDRVPVRQAVTALAASAQVRIQYQAEVLDAVTTPVTLHALDMPLGTALDHVFAGTKLRAVPLAADFVTIEQAGESGQRGAATGAIAGTVKDSSDGRLLSNVTVAVSGLKLSVLTNAKGEFLLGRVPVGKYIVTAKAFGYKPGSQEVTVTDGERTTARFALAPTATVLSGVVTTGSGEREKVEVGNSIATVNVDSIMQVTPVATVSQLLAYRVPGLQALAGSGAVGAPTRLRVRGISSIESGNSPIVIVDGIRVSTTATTDVNNTIYAGVTGSTGSDHTAANDLSSRLDDIDPNSIASIEVMKGPAASTLYGSDAADGVIIIKTKHGQAGPPRWNVYTNHTALIQPTDYAYPIEEAGYPLRGNAALHIPCSLANLYNGTCVPIPDSTIGFNMLKNPNFTPQALGHNNTYGFDVSGGVPVLQYYFGGTYLDQLGTAKLPNVNANWITNANDGQKLAKSILRPNARTNGSGTARLSGNFGGQSDFALGATFISQYQRVGNDGMSTLLGGGGDVPRYPSDTAPLSGFSDWNATRSQNIKHIQGNAQSDWRPSWGGGQLFSANGVYGWDLSQMNDTYLAPRGSCFPLCTSTSDHGVLGYIDTGRETDYTQTATVGAVLSVPLTSWLLSQTRFGGNYVGASTDNLYGYNTNLIPGLGIYGAGGSPRIEELGDFSGTVGWYLEQNLNFRQTLYLTMGLRKDAGSALGQTVTPVYPKWNGSWIISQEPFFPRAWSDVVSTLRLRFAYGRAGVMPSSEARISDYDLETGATADNGTSNGYYAEMDAPGNLAVRPERSAESEGGFDLELFNSRFTLGLTLYDKSTKDAIVSTPIAPSLGIGVNSTLMLNVGDVDNHGMELESSLRVLDGNTVSYSINASVATSYNKLVRLAPGSTVSTSCGLTCGGNASVNAVGFPLFGRWAYPILGWKDINGNGFLEPNEIMVSDSLAYVGPSTPTRTMYVGHTLGFFRNRVSLRANFAYSGGEVQYNQARQNSASFLAVVNGPGALSQRDQACLIVASVEYTNERTTDWCYMENVKVWRLQDLSLTLVAPTAVAQWARAQSAILTLSGTNLHLWTNYHGIDPNINTTPVTGNQEVAGAAFPTPRSFGFRLQLTY